MKKRIVLALVLGVILTFVLTACWDQRLLRDHVLILAMGFDREEPDKILKTISFPAPSDQQDAESQENSQQIGSEVESTIGNTVKDAEKNLDDRIAEQFDRSKVRVVIFGETLAKEGIYSTLDSLYRDLRGPLNANNVIFRSEAKEALSRKVEGSLLISNIYAELINSAEKSGIIKNYSTQESRTYILAQGRDLILPLLTLDEKGSPYIEGTALFHGDQMTGTMSMKETIAYLMLSDQVTEKLAINLQVSDAHEDANKNFVNISIRSLKQKLKVQTENDQVEANVEVTLKVEIDEYAADDLDNKEKNDELEKEIEKDLEKIAERTLEKLLKANSDALGIGEKVRAYHHDTWEKLDWSEAYEHTQIKATFNVDIVHHGIIN